MIVIPVAPVMRASSHFGAVMHAVPVELHPQPEPAGGGHRPFDGQVVAPAGRVVAVPSMRHQPISSCVDGGCAEDVLVLQVPAVWHAVGAWQVTCVGPWQAPAWQTSNCVQASPSLQAVPSALAGFEQTPVAVLQVPAV